MVAFGFWCWLTSLSRGHGVDRPAGRRALPLGDAPRRRWLHRARPRRVLGQPLVLELLLRVWQRSQGCLQRAAADSLLVERPMERLPRMYPCSRRDWMNTDTAALRVGIAGCATGLDRLDRSSAGGSGRCGEGRLGLDVHGDRVTLAFEIADPMHVPGENSTRRFTGGSRSPSGMWAGGLVSIVDRRGCRPPEVRRQHS